MNKYLLLLIYSRGVLHWLLNFIVIIFVLICYILAALLRQKKLTYKVVQYWSSFVLWSCGVKVESKNIHHAPDTSFLVLFNHKSYLDIFVLFHMSPRQLHFGAKKSLFYNPLYGLLMKVSGHLVIDSSSPRKTLKAYSNLRERVDKGDCFALAPEGTRYPQGVLGRFKSGPFILAIQHQIPILPIVIHNTEIYMPKGSLFFNRAAWTGTVTVECLPPVLTKNMDKKDYVALKNRVYQNMKSCLSAKASVD